ncbi:MAG: hypothetical protein IJE15_09325 [Bacteroidaceae bacterium]|nr:hypothetical protein [Bacteroidaceae bacterium]
MNKKTYITPAMEAMNIETVEMMAASIGTNIDGLSVGGDAEEGDVAGSRGRRGSWGDLWD